jgi:hypothetical protein
MPPTLFPAIAFIPDDMIRIRLDHIRAGIMWTDRTGKHYHVTPVCDRRGYFFAILATGGRHSRTQSWVQVDPAPDRFCAICGISDFLEQCSTASVLEIGTHCGTCSIAGVIGGQCGRVAIQKHLERHAADVPVTADFAPDAVSLCPGPNSRIFSLRDK